MDDEWHVDYWETHCWYKRFNESERCVRPAQWRGQGSTAFDKAWRACDEHRHATDTRRTRYSKLPLTRWRSHDSQRRS